MGTIAIIPGRGPVIVPRTPHTAFEGRVLDELKTLNVKLEESIGLGKENGAEIRSLRKELGMEGLHGRLPTIEAAIARLDRAQEDDHQQVQQRLDKLEELAHQNSGSNFLKQRLITVASSTGTVALLGWIAKLLGYLH
jgi:chromosome segregation ATPase